MGGAGAVRGGPDGLRREPRALKFDPETSTGDPFSRFRELYDLEAVRNADGLPGACCLSTIGTDGFPNARFVALKEVSGEGFVLTGPLSSRKGEEIRANANVALTFWWPHTGVQVRVQGRASAIPDTEAERHFRARPREARLTARASQQGRSLANPEDLEAAWEREERAHRGRPVPRPEDWGGFRIEPIRIEFLEFGDRRLHSRVLYQSAEDGWETSRLQP